MEYFHNLQQRVATSPTTYNAPTTDYKKQKEWNISGSLFM